VTWSDALLRRSEPTGAERELFAKILLHEMAHMWFGNIVTMRWWDDLWLNEAFAELACNWAATRATAYTQAWAGHLAGEKLEAYLADQGPTSHPIRQPIADVAQAASIFDAITYPKGASVLRQLMVHLGEPVFEAGMTAYFRRYAWGNATLEDLVGTLAATAGRDLTAWRAGWLETAGTDRLTLERDGDGLVLVARGPQDGPPRPHTLAVGAYRSEGNGLRREALVEVAVDGPRTPVPLPADAEILLVNDEDLTFAAVRPEHASRDRLLAQAGRLPSAISRGVAVATAWDMLVAGDAGPEEMVRSLLGVLRAETAETVLEPYLRLAGQVAELWAPSGTRQALQAEIAQTCRELAADPGRRRVALRALARTAADADELARLAAGGDADVDLRWRTLIRRAELGAAVDAEVEALRAEDPDPDAGARELAVRAAVADGAAKEAVWTRLTEDPTVPLGAFREVASAFWRPDQEPLLAPYAERYAALLPGFDRGGMIRAMVLASALFPVVGAGAPEVERVVEAGAGTSPVVRQTVRERADEVRRMLRARAGTR